MTYQALPETLAIDFPELLKSDDYDFSYWAAQGPTALLEQVVRPFLVELATIDNRTRLQTALDSIEKLAAHENEAIRVAINTGLFEGLVATDYQALPTLVPLMGDRSLGECRAIARHYAIPPKYLELLGTATLIDLQVCVTIRPAYFSDLRKLEWFGKYSRFREIFQKDFGRAAKGEMAYLVAVVKEFPIGQVEVELTKYRDEGVGEVIALRVLEPFRRCGIATQLMDSAENEMRQHSLHMAQLGVNKQNEAALKLYEKRGYVIVGEDTESWGYTDLDGTYHHVDDDEWKMQKTL